MTTAPATETRPATPHRASTASARPLLWLGFFLTAVYLLTAKGFSDLIDAEATYLITENLVEHRRVDLPRASALTPEVFAAGHAFSGRDGRTYSQYWLGYPLVQVPFYLAGRLLARAVAVVAPHLRWVQRALPRVAVNLALVLITVGEALMLCAVAARLLGDLRFGLATALLFAFATVAWPYSKIGFYEPFLGLCLLTVMLALLLAARRPRRWGWWLLAGFVWGWGFATKPTFVLILPGLALFVFLVRKHRTISEAKADCGWWWAASACLAGLAPWLAVVLWYNWLRSGSIWGPGYAPWNWEVSLSWEVFGKQLVAYLLAPGRGILVFCPVVVLAIIGARGAWRKQPALVGAALLLFAPYWLFHAARVAPDSWAWGPRYLVPVLGPLMLLVPWGIGRCAASRAGRVSLGVLVSLSVVAQLLGIVVPYGAWLHQVRAETGRSDAVIFTLRYWPLWGQIHSLSRVSTRRLDLAASGLDTGPASQAFKQGLRQGLDFWWFTAWRLGTPGYLLLVPCVMLVAVALWSGWRVFAYLGSP